MKPKEQFIRLLQTACSGEMAADFAYRGHALSVKDLAERLEIQKIEQEEWDHREGLMRMLSAMNAKPRLAREIGMRAIGLIIYTLCRIGGWMNIFNFGWFFSMYGAGKLEQGNIIEYKLAAELAEASGEQQYKEALLKMAEVEWDHELYFRQKALSSRWSSLIRVWKAPASKDQIRNF